jgi:hypothetical protein
MPQNKSAPLVPAPLADVGSQADQANRLGTGPKLPPPRSGKLGPDPVVPSHDGRNVVRRNLRGGGVKK